MYCSAGDTVYSLVKSTSSAHADPPQHWGQSVPVPVSVSVSVAYVRNQTTLDFTFFQPNVIRNMKKVGKFETFFTNTWIFKKKN